MFYFQCVLTVAMGLTAHRHVLIVPSGRVIKKMVSALVAAQPAGKETSVVCRSST